MDERAVAATLLLQFPPNKPFQLTRCALTDVRWCGSQLSVNRVGSFAPLGFRFLDIENYLFCNMAARGSAPVVDIRDIFAGYSTKLTGKIGVSLPQIVESRPRVICTKGRVDDARNQHVKSLFAHNVFNHCFYKYNHSLRWYDCTYINSQSFMNFDVFNFYVVWINLLPQFD